MTSKQQLFLFFSNMGRAEVRQQLTAGTQHLTYRTISKHRTVCYIFISTFPIYYRTFIIQISAEKHRSPSLLCPGVREWPAERGEGPEAVRPAHQQQGVPAHLHPDTGNAALFLHEGPRQRGLTHHDGPARATGVRHRRPKTPAVGPHRPQPGEQEPPETAAAQVPQRALKQTSANTRTWLSRSPQNLKVIYLFYLNFGKYQPGIENSRRRKNSYFLITSTSMFFFFDIEVIKKYKDKGINIK